MILYGKTAENGESQIIELARGLLPPGAICSVPASKMADERHVVGLVGKLLNTADELSAEAIASDPFKAIVIGDPIQGRDVYKARIEFRSAAQHLFATNQLPGFKGGVDRGVQRRLMVITFDRTIPLRERIEGIGRRIAVEKADLLLAWAVDGASRVIQQRNFAVPASSAEALRDWILNDDPVLAWIEACVKVQPIVNGGPMLRTREAYTKFTSWATEEGFRRDKLPAINNFALRVQAAHRGIEYKRIAKGRYFLGIVVPEQ